MFRKSQSIKSTFDWKMYKGTVHLAVFYAFLGSGLVKAACRTLMNLTPGKVKRVHLLDEENNDVWISHQLFPQNSLLNL